ncbi:flagellar hook-basal body complex protein [Nevskia soli]|uniref:flagellar hook-basal body complex protein n=1 Tax=Nevskia soli TaxID=418856 RepID=UPI0009FC50C3|nr:flagellar hook-basal body complex protein [Nevskia soli]
MSAFSSIYTSLTGLTGFSDALNVISNNVANLNSAGFKASSVLFRDLGPVGAKGDSPGSNFGLDSNPGEGVEYVGTLQSFAQGTFQSTGSPTDLAINGNGFFVLKKSDGQILYSQAGQFTFDQSGFLIDGATKDRVQALGANGALSDIQIDMNAKTAPVATTQVALSGTLSTNQSSYTLSNVSVVEPDGSNQTLAFTFTLATSSSGSGGTGSGSTSTSTTTWNVTAKDSSGDQLLSNASITFDSTGTPEQGANTLSITLPGNASTQPITINFGSPGSFSGVTSQAAGTSGSSVKVASSDGKPIGTLTQQTIDGSGSIQLTYSNGDTSTGQQLALASFTDPNTLIQVGSSQFKLGGTAAVEQPEYGVAGQNQFGSIESGNIELANVDLSQQFSQIIVLQQAFQGGSEVLNVSSQLLTKLYSDLNGNAG